jgi:hypothetical protein
MMTNDDKNVVRRLVATSPLATWHLKKSLRWGVIGCAVVVIGCVVLVPLGIVSRSADSDDVGNVVTVRRSSTSGGDH